MVTQLEEKRKFAAIIAVIAVIFLFTLSIIRNYNRFVHETEPAIIRNSLESIIHYRHNAETHNSRLIPMEFLDIFLTPVNYSGVVFGGLWPGVDWEYFYLQRSYELDNDVFYLFSGGMFFESTEDFITLEIVNGLDENKLFIVKLFYNYTEISFLPYGFDDFVSELIIEIPTNYELRLPFQLDTTVEMNEQRNKLTMVKFMIPDLHIVELPQLEFYVTGMALNYEINFGGTTSIALNQSNNIIAKEVENIAPTIQLKVNDLDTGIYFWPDYIISSPNEEIELIFTINANRYVNSHMENFVIISLLDWKQVEMSGYPYIFLYAPENTTAGHHIYFTITAPSETGMFEFVAIAVSDPLAPPCHINFFPLEMTRRVTIIVE